MRSNGAPHKEVIKLQILYQKNERRFQLPSEGAHYDFSGAHYNHMESDLLSHCTAVRAWRLLIKQESDKGFDSELELSVGG